MPVPSSTTARRYTAALNPGANSDWAMMAGGPDPLSINAGYFKGMVFEDPNWDFRTFDVDRDTRLAEARTGKAIDAYNPDLKPFAEKRRQAYSFISPGMRLAVPPRTIIDYYSSVEKAMGGPAQTQDFARLFMVAGTECAPDSAMPRILIR